MICLPFHKMHALGNDFMVINGLKHPLPNKEQIRAFSDRRRGVGFDQLLYLAPSAVAQADFQYRIFNADGNEVEQCGNGVRCIAAFIREQKLSLKETLTLHCLAGIIEISFIGEKVKVNLGSVKKPIEIRPLKLFPEEPAYDLICIDLGNPHAVLCVQNITHFELEKIGRACNQSSYFPHGVNFEIMQIINENELMMRVFERGVGETQACGSGACAVVLASVFLQKQKSPLTVHLPGGTLFIEWAGEAVSPIYMTGPAQFVFSGEILNLNSAVKP
jgi:diaminopimelate epimerase